MILKEKLKLVESWKKLQFSSETMIEHDPNFWASEELWKLSEENPELCWEILVLIFESTDDPNILGNLAAGPLEDLLTYNGDKIIGKVEMFSFKNNRFRLLLRGVWRNDIPDEIWKRIEEIKGISIK